MHIALGLALTGCRAPDPGPAGSDGPVLTPLVDLDPDPAVFEGELVARDSVLPLADGELVDVFSYNGGVPGPEIRVRRGDRLVLHLDNQLAFDTTIHWHGIEGTNAADGTPVTQGPVHPGASFTYDFVAPRPGTYWYHPHLRGAQAVFGGLYAPLVVEDEDEQTLRDMGVLPEHELVLTLSDVSAFDGEVISVEVDNAMVVMNGTEGDHLLVNGQERPTFEVPAGEGVRLRLVNTSITRFWRLSLPGHTMYRVGGEGGLLEAVRVEGGTAAGVTLDPVDGTELGPAEVDLGYQRGEILLAPAERADVVVVPDGAPGDVLTLRWEDTARGRHGMWMEGDEMVMGDADDDGLRPGVDVARLLLVEGAGEPFAIAEGDPILAAVGRTVEPVDVSGPVVDFTGERGTALQERMDMWQDADGAWQMSTAFFVDEVSWMPDHHQGPEQPEAPTAKHARVGDVVVWDVHNETRMAHPFHLHGFSYQPVRFVRRIVDEATEEVTGAVAWDVDVTELEDTTLLPPHTTLQLRVRLDDPMGDGGAVGRWMNHCHILQHGEAGMMTELVVAP